MSTTRRPYAGPRTLAVTRFLLVVTAVVALVAGPAYWINGLTRAHGPVDVTVRYVVTEDAGSPAGFDATPDRVVLPLPSALADLDDDARSGVVLRVGNDDLDVAVWDLYLPRVGAGAR